MDLRFQSCRRWECFGASEARSIDQRPALSTCLRASLQLRNLWPPLQTTVSSCLLHL